ncbi:hypothetical protein MtrunA17_Chr7g0238241 [Medicago truncatula]|uniref:DUF247 domain protein n=1 Tax=Medicago truncatula TaxID=3880 RepID=G7L3E1_MEDTR|nr:uncharacterized protein LOC11426237 [Medicago truncatula]AES79247.2 DUF247 domain protein [Medicago truncatula]RHN46069.1 hypothetical protein MtrunA17_Chr7g0238241 [Medicago truncatula]
MMASQTINEKFVELQKSKQTPQNSRPKIQRVAEYLRNRKNFEKHYSPKLLSVGPIHHDNTNLKLGEKYKLMWAAKYIENTGHIPEDLHKKIADNIDELKGHFGDDVLTLTGKSLEGFGSLEEKLSWMLFVDGCSLLYILEKAKLDEPGHMNIKVDQLVLVMMDVLLLENQLPYVVLKLLWKDNDSELIKSMMTFLDCHHWATPDESQPDKEKDMVPKGKGEGEHSVSITNESQLETPTHLLDLQRKIILTTSNSKTKSNEANNNKWSQKNSDENVKKNSKEDVKMMTYRSIQDLRAVGIRLKSSATRRPTDVDFSAGWFAAKLTLPEIVVDDTSAATFLNLIAYEMCPDFENDYGICSFAAFMDSLIDRPEDVKELRSKGILLNSLGSDEEVADFFNIISTDLVPNTKIYFEVREKIHEHYCNKCKTWIALGFHTYFSNPWAIIAFLAAFIALALTFIQTWFAVDPAC